MSTVIAQPYGRGSPDYLGRALAVHALLLLVVFVLGGGYRVLEGRDEDC